MGSVRQLILITGCIGMVSLSVSVGLSSSNPVVPPASKGESCVAPLQIMRRDHMEMLFHQRDRTMYSGERDSRFSLTGCLECHTQKDPQGHYIPINAEGQFCQVCHEYAAVKMDCFQCHATTPGKQVKLDE